MFNYNSYILNEWIEVQNEKSYISHPFSLWIMFVLISNETKQMYVTKVLYLDNDDVDLFYAISFDYFCYVHRETAYKNK